jgi:hypothetical protein
VAEETNADAYRDLLREIDRAFDGYERSAVRHGWLTDRGLNSDGSQVAAADTARRRSDALLGHVDLAEFVASVIAVETGRVTAEPGLLRLPADWLAGLDGLPGFDGDAQVLRVTRDRSNVRDKKGRSLAFLGRAHPVVRRAIACVQRIGGSICDNRVSAACADEGEPLSVLLTFSAELHSATRIEFQRVITVLLPVRGGALELGEPELWLRRAVEDRELPTAGLWQRLFANWVPRRRPVAEVLATSVMQRDAAQFAADNGRQISRGEDELQSWLRDRSDDICGAFVPRTGDLFGAVASGPDWQLLSVPLDRLVAFAADADNTPARRREANSVVELYQRRSQERSSRAALAVPILRQTGMLMMVPTEHGT